MSMINFGTKNALINFSNKCYEYGGSQCLTKRELTIGGYESACLADLVASFLLTKTVKLFKKTSVYKGIYPDDGLIVFKGLWSGK